MVYQNELYHHGIKGQKWGVRRFRNKDGSLTEAGKKRQARQDKKHADKHHRVVERFHRETERLQREFSSERFKATVAEASSKFTEMNDARLRLADVRKKTFREASPDKVRKLSDKLVETYCKEQGINEDVDGFKREVGNALLKAQKTNSAGEYSKWMSDVTNLLCDEPNNAEHRRAVDDYCREANKYVNAIRSASDTVSKNHGPKRAAYTDKLLREAAKATGQNPYSFLNVDTTNRAFTRRYKELYGTDVADDVWGKGYTVFGSPIAKQSTSMLHSTELYHHGVKGQKWGVRRYRNADGSLTAAGKKREAKLERYRQRELTALDKKYEKREARADRKVAKAEAKYQKWLDNNRDEHGKDQFGPNWRQRGKVINKQQRAYITKGLHSLERSRVEKMTTDELSNEIKRVNTRTVTNVALASIGIYRIPTTSMSYKTQLRTSAQDRSELVRNAARKYRDGWTSYATVGKRHERLVGPYVEA